jgi:hypothetical protein
MQPCREVFGFTAGGDLQRLHRRAGGSQHREGVGLDVERVGGGGAGPVPPETIR